MSPGLTAATGVLLQCVASVINQKWGVENNAQGDIALCFLQSPSRFDPVKLADESKSAARSSYCC